MGQAGLGDFAMGSEAMSSRPPALPNTIPVTLDCMDMADEPPLSGNISRGTKR